MSSHFSNRTDSFASCQQSSGSSLATSRRLLAANKTRVLHKFRRVVYVIRGPKSVENVAQAAILRNWAISIGNRRCKHLMAAQAQAQGELEVKRRLASSARLCGCGSQRNGLAHARDIGGLHERLSWLRRRIASSNQSSDRSAGCHRRAVAVVAANTRARAPTDNTPSRGAIITLASQLLIYLYVNWRLQRRVRRRRHSRRAQQVQHSSSTHASGLSYALEWLATWSLGRRRAR